MCEIDFAMTNQSIQAKTRFVLEFLAHRVTMMYEPIETTGCFPHSWSRFLLDFAMSTNKVAHSGSSLRSETSTVQLVGGGETLIQRSVERDFLSPSDKASLEKRLERIEAILGAMAQRQLVREWYTTHQLAQILEKAEFTVREWCRLRRIRAEKRRSGRGAHASWAIAHSEILRVQREGLLPIDSKRVH